MKKLLLAFAVLISATVNAQVQYGGVIRAQNNAAVIGNVQRTNDNLKVIDSALSAKVPSGLVVTAGRLQVELPAGGTGLTNTEIRATALPVSGTVSANAGTNLNTSALALEAGNLATIKTNTDKIPALGQALAAASTPIVLTAIQQAALTPPAQITGFALAANQQTNAITDAQIRATPLPVSGTVSTGLSQPLTDIQLRAVAVPVSGTVAVSNFPATQPVSGSFFQTTQPVSIATMPTTPVTGTFFQATQPVSIASVPSHPVTNAGTFAVQATVSGTVPVSGAFFQTTQPISAAALPLPTGAATEATAAAINTKIPSGLVVTTGRLQVELPAGGTGLTNTELRATPVPVSVPVGGFVSVVNSSVTNLAVSAVFTGTGEDVSAYASIKVSVFASAASAVDGLQIQQSTNNVDWDGLDIYSIPAATNRAFSVPVNAKFFRIVYTNGGTLTTSFRLQVIYNIADKQPSSVRPQDGRANDNDFVETLGFMMGYNSVTNTWNRVGVSNATSGGNENLFDRIKVNASLRMIDNAQPSGSKLVGVTGTQTGGLDVNIKNTSLPVTGTFFQTTQPVSIAGTIPVSGTFFQPTQAVSLVTDADNTSTSTLTGASQTVVLAIGGKSAGGIVITGTWVGTITFEGSVDGTNWNAINAVAASTSTPQSTTTVNGLYRLTPAGLLQVRVIMTAFTSGTSTVFMRASAGTGGVFANQVVPVTIISSPTSTLAVTTTAAAATAATLTLPAVVGQFHYITSIEIVLYSAAARTGAAAPTVVTTTNLPGAVAFTFSTAGAIGTTDIQNIIKVTPFRSSVVNTATTIVAPIAAGGIWRITVTYFTAP